jgi:ABC-type sugar transport system permease subunit
LGGIDYLSDIFGLPSVDWLSYPSTAFWAVVIAAVWEWTPFVTLMYLATLEGLPQEPFEAARIDGASIFQILRHVTLPLLRPTTYVILFFRIIEALAIFPLIFVMTSGGPAEATEPTNYYAFISAFDYLKIGYASSMIVLFFALIIAFNLYFVKGILQKM